MIDLVLIAGGGINQEIAPQVQRIIEAAGVAVNWERFDLVDVQPDEAEERLDEVAAAVRRTGVALKTRLVAPITGYRNPNVVLRQKLGLYAGVRAVRSLPGLPTRFPGLDLLIIRENTEDIYKGLEHEIVPGVVESLKVVTEAASERIARFAFYAAETLGRQHVTFVHKANIMKQSDGLFMRTVRRVAEEHPQFGYREIIVDAASMQMVLDPYQFDVMLMGNLYGDILSSLGNGLTGGISSSLGVDIGDDARIYEAVHGDAPHIAGEGVANPLPLLTPAGDLLRYLGEDAAADRIQGAVTTVLERSDTLTPDLGGTATTVEMTDAIIGALG
jgi:isocitrate dehydrogenase (NAD+)